MNNIEHTILSEKDAGKSVKEFEIEVSADTLERYKKNTLRKIAAGAELPGFRKGKAPEALVLKETGEMHVLQEAAETIVNEITISLLTDKKLRFIGEPQITLMALAPQNPLKFKVAVTIAPEISLPDYKKIAASVNSQKQKPTEVTEKEVQVALERIKKILSTESTTPDQPSTKPFELSDETVKLLGGFSSLAEFSEKLKRDLALDKEKMAHEQRTLEIIERIVAETKVELPEMLVEHELERIESEFSHDVERMGQKIEDYLAKIKKSREDLHREWRANAIKRAIFELIMPRIAHAEKLSVPPEETERETSHLMEHHKDADKEVARLYVERSLLRQKVLQFLETCSV